MIKFFKNFRKDEDGAVTVDWVVLTAAVAVLGTLVYSQISQGVTDMTSSTSTFLSDHDSDSYLAGDGAGEGEGGEGS
ncbi:pilus assembly protein [Tritonibacter scottomollicae]|uniref:Pilus assembly protein n=1 Tax=Tritonibacter scottomollicae TaxID=483013 RepID=A0ABZ0HBT3_TRISK|nr:pilus assembly protein [Tritonibacter scottomollicae]WOI31534.1 pilus assembly protein [Tritonibacter scottomollicae]